MTILSDSQLRRAAKDGQVDRRSLTPTQTERLVRQMIAAIEQLPANIASQGSPLTEALDNIVFLLHALNKPAPDVRPKAHTFTVKRDADGFIKSIHVVSK